MKKILTFLIMLIGICAVAQENNEPKVKIDIDRKLYPIEDEDTYSSEDSQAMIGVTFMEGNFALAEYILEATANNMKLQNTVKAGTFEDNWLSISGDANDETIGGEMYIELYVVNAEDAGGVIVIMSGYPVAEKSVYGKQGKKAAESATLMP